MAQHKPTDEQQAILDAMASGGNMAISARAGTGKTTTLRMIAEANPKKQMLYIVFNKSAQEASAKHFPPNVTVKTSHALAFPEFGRHVIDRVVHQQSPHAWKMAQVLGLRDFEVSEGHIISGKAQASLANAMVLRFCHSADPMITEDHLRYVEGLERNETDVLARRLVPYAKKIWADITRPTGLFKPTHDSYLKQWQLTNPSLTGYDVLLYDEAQDANPCVASVVESQDHAQIIAVGDSAQAIYAWRGAGDFLARMKADHRLSLTQSWRFGQAVADEGNLWLLLLDPSCQTLVRGRPDHQSEVTKLGHADAVLCRTNAGAVTAAIAAQAAGEKVHLEVAVDNIKKLAYACDQLQQGKQPAHPLLAAFRHWGELLEHIKDDPTADLDLALTVRLVESFSVSTVIRAVDSCVPEASADVVISTAHKAKGLEWPNVKIGSDFPEPRDKKTGTQLPVPDALAQLAYVAVTRAKDKLDLGGLAWIHDRPEVQSFLPAPSAVPAPEPPPTLSGPSTGPELGAA